MGYFIERNKEETIDLLGNHNIFFHGTPSMPRDGRPIAFVDDIEQKIYYPMSVDSNNRVIFYEDTEGY